MSRNCPGAGLAIAHYLLRAPARARVIGIARTLAPLQDLRTQYGENFEFVCGDISQPGVGTEALSKAVTKFGRLSAVIVNHGVLDPVQKVSDANPQELRALFEVNFFSALELVSKAIRELRKTRGRVVFVSSSAAITAYVYYPPLLLFMLRSLIACVSTDWERMARRRLR